MEHDIHDFVSRSQREIQEEYERIQKRATEDPGTAGDQGEENWATLIRNWLPRYFQVVTKGRILSQSCDASPQIDILVLYPSYPKILIDKKLRNYALGVTNRMAYNPMIRTIIGFRKVGIWLWKLLMELVLVLS